MKLGVHIGYWGLGLSSRGPARRSSRRPSGSATTRSGPPRPTAPTPRPCSAGSPGRRRRSGSARRSSRCPAARAAMTAMTAATIDQLSDGRMLLGIGSSGPAGRRGLARAALRQAAPAHARVRRGRAHGARARARRVPRRDARAAAARRPRQGAEADDRAGAGADPDLPRGDRAEEHGAGRRDRRRLDPDAVLARARLRAAPAARGGRRARRANRSTASTSRRPSTCSSPTTSRRARDAMRPFIALYVGGMGSRKQNFYNQLVQPLRLRGRGARRSRTSTSKASARRRWRRSRTS